MIETAFFKKNKILDIVSDFMKETFEISQERVIDQLKPFVDMLVDDIIVFFEFPYVDKFYRDTFYNFFSVKHNQCERDSIRLSFFDNSIKEELFFNEKYKDNINEHFFGYITLRPTTYSSIGHSFLSPKILKNKKFVTSQSHEKV
jgi:hypothetical protein